MEIGFENEVSWHRGFIGLKPHMGLPRMSEPVQMGILGHNKLALDIYFEIKGVFKKY